VTLHPHATDEGPASGTYAHWRAWAALASVAALVAVVALWAWQRGQVGGPAAAAMQLSTFVDPRDGGRYPVVRIGTQTWLGRNLDIAIGHSWCVEGHAASCPTHGRLYDWDTATHACPPGWHLPSDDEWSTLQKAVGDDGAALSSRAPGDTGAAGFEALPNGFRAVDGRFLDQGNEATFWSATAPGSGTAFMRRLPAHSHEIARHDRPKGIGYGVRCVAN
jgi:uncharacterized protein (TIGR02145 family)